MSHEPVLNTVSLDEQIMLAHENHDAHRLSYVYEQGALRADTVDSACFLATQAYIFALESDHHNQDRLRQFLIKHGREQG